MQSITRSCWFYLLSVFPLLSPPFCLYYSCPKSNPHHNSSQYCPPTHTNPFSAGHSECFFKNDVIPSLPYCKSCRMSLTFRMKSISWLSSEPTYHPSPIFSSSTNTSIQSATQRFFPLQRDPAVSFLSSLKVQLSLPRTLPPCYPFHGLADVSWFSKSHFACFPLEKRSVTPSVV